MDELENFIVEYSSEDFDFIKFDWNGEHGDHLEDPNMDFRMQLCNLLVEDFSIASDELILDLYQELSKAAKETWSVYHKFNLFAQEILNRNPTEYSLAYAKGATQSFDTLLASGAITLSDIQKQKIVDHTTLELKNANVDDTEYYEFLLQRFCN